MIMVALLIVVLYIVCLQMSVILFRPKVIGMDILMCLFQALAVIVMGARIG